MILEASPRSARTRYGRTRVQELGEFEAKTWINGIAQAIRAVKVDQQSLRLQNEFYERSKHPLETPQ